MSKRALALAPLLLLAAAVSRAADRYVPIAGTVNNFRTDTRIFNPSFTSSLLVEAFFLPTGNRDNTDSVKAGRTFAVQPRQMVVRDDIVKTLFERSSEIGGMLFRSDAELEVSSRIYAVVAAGTLGQLAVGLDLSDARRNGVLLQLKSNSAYRTNIGALNPNGTAATVQWKLFNRNNEWVATRQDVMPPYAVIAPANITTYFSGVSGADLSDCWVSFSSDLPLMPYASVIDNATSDPSYVMPQRDIGLDQLPPAKTYAVTLRSYAIDISPRPDIRRGDAVVMRISCLSGGHGFTVVAPDDTVVVPARSYGPGQVGEYTFIASREGTYKYFCTVQFCDPEFGFGHTQMYGTFVVGPRP